MCKRVVFVNLYALQVKSRPKSGGASRTSWQSTGSILHSGLMSIRNQNMMNYDQLMPMLIMILAAGDNNENFHHHL